MTNEEKQALIEHIQTQLDLLRNVTMRYADECEIVDIEQDIKVQEIALAALTARPVKMPALELVATLTLKDSQYEWDRICYIPDGEHDLYIIKEVQE